MKFFAYACVIAFGIFTFARADALTNNVPDEIARALDRPTEVVLFSLHPPGIGEPHGVTLHGYSELGKVKVTDEEGRIATKSLRVALDGWRGMSVNCFNPRHGMRVIEASHTYDFVFCYECQGLEAYKDDKFLYELGISGDPAILNGLLRKYHIPLSKE